MEFNKRIFHSLMAVSRRNIENPVGIAFVMNERLKRIKEARYPRVWACGSDSEDATLKFIQKMRTANKFKDRDLDKLFSNGIVYCTEILSHKALAQLKKFGCKEIYYAGKASYSENPFDIDYDLKVKNFPEWDFSGSYKHWTDNFFDNAYDAVKDRKVPFTIISYNKFHSEGKEPFLKVLRELRVEEMTEESNWPVIIFVRKSQEESYNKYIEKHGYKYAKIVAFPDEAIGNAGATRRVSQKWLYMNGYHYAFQSDDDITSLGYAIDGVSSKGWGIADSMFLQFNCWEILAMWQVAMEKVNGTKNNVIMSCGMPTGFSWKNEYKTEDWSVIWSCGALTQLVCFNVKAMVENDLWYKDIADAGLDDIDMKIRIWNGGFHAVAFPWLSYGADLMGAADNASYYHSDITGNTPTEDLKNRFVINSEKLKENWGGISWISFREKRGLQQCCIKVQSLRKWQMSKGYLTDNRKVLFDIWQNGTLINEMRENNYEQIEY